jgi:hypothetical protein
MFNIKRRDQRRKTEGLNTLVSLKGRIKRKPWVSFIIKQKKMDPTIFEEQERQLFLEFGIDDDVVNQLFPNINKKRKRTMQPDHWSERISARYLRHRNRDQLLEFVSIMSLFMDNINLRKKHI